jgi:hypothetical protein
MQYLIILHTDAPISDIGHCILAMDPAGITEFAFCRQNYCVGVMLRKGVPLSATALYVTVLSSRYQIQCSGARGYKVAHSPAVLPSFFTSTSNSDELANSY